uniref:Uncharacterized protein n=2 Tax=Micrurus TaxID=8634 RepID=A0A2D4F6L4_MICCO
MKQLSNHGYCTLFFLSHVTSQFANISIITIEDFIACNEGSKLAQNLTTKSVLLTKGQPPPTSKKVINLVDQFRLAIKSLFTVFIKDTKDPNYNILYRNHPKNQVLKNCSFFY